MLKYTLILKKSFDGHYLGHQCPLIPHELLLLCCFCWFTLVVKIEINSRRFFNVKSIPYTSLNLEQAPSQETHK